LCPAAGQAGNAQNTAAANGNPILNVFIVCIAYLPFYKRVSNYLRKLRSRPVVVVRIPCADRQTLARSPQAKKGRGVKLERARLGNMGGGSDRSAGVIRSEKCIAGKPLYIRASACRSAESVPRLICRHQKPLSRP